MEIARHSCSKAEIETIRQCLTAGYLAAQKAKDTPPELIEQMRRLHLHMRTAQRMSFTYIYGAIPHVENK